MFGHGMDGASLIVEYAGYTFCIAGVFVLLLFSHGHFLYV